MKKKTSYLESGVNIEGGDQAVEWLGKELSSKGKANVIGGFSGTFDPKYLAFKDPLWLASTDGVGTKLMLALEENKLQHLGQDLLAMCVNDLIVSGAIPLFFMDYYACGKLDQAQFKAIMASIVNACELCGVALLGGETAEMPGLYQDNKFDLAGFAVGAQERGKILNKDNVKEGDRLIGLSSSGVHSNGFSLVRALLQNCDDFSPFKSREDLINALLLPTTLYREAFEKISKLVNIKSAAHITGGGIAGNLSRAIPAGLACTIDSACWSSPKVYDWLASLVDTDELRKTFNCGLGLILIVEKNKINIEKISKECGLEAFDLGHVKKSQTKESVIWA